MENHSAVLAMGLLAGSGIVYTLPLVEVESYSRLEGFDIFVTIRVVGRVKLIKVLQEEPYLKAVCIEMVDTLPPNLEECVDNLVSLCRHIRLLFLKTHFSSWPVSFSL